MNVVWWLLGWCALSVLLGLGIPVMIRLLSDRR